MLRLKVAFSHKFSWKSTYLRGLWYYNKSIRRRSKRLEMLAWLLASLLGCTALDSTASWTKRPCRTSKGNFYATLSRFTNSFSFVPCAYTASIVFQWFNTTFWSSWSSISITFFCFRCFERSWHVELYSFYVWRRCLPFLAFVVGNSWSDYA